ncbi:MAG TPA: HAD family hydrolase [Desulfurivibrio alkaliphilus]|uniref:phosphoglycolate phosphatase n=1 Tax=Desulfurivibrio alkaliphilus TaxID=427923 RepID=A0A7C2TFY5_9BACT|nr:HAD family hydrolase [Desulfurivibrio alkaliphilus]
MPQARAIIFDLDGTLLDSLADIADAMNRVLAGLKLPEHPRQAYRYMVGEGIATLVNRALPPTRRDAETQETALAAMREEYGRNWRKQTLPYPRIPALLTTLNRRGITMAVLSNKPDEFTQQAVRELLAPHRFAIVRGARADTPRKPDPAGALALAEELNLPPAEFLFVGDSGIDMQTAKRSGMFAIGVLWGFRPAEELRQNGADALISTPPQLLEFLDEQPPLSHGEHRIQSQHASFPVK